MYLKKLSNADNIIKIIKYTNDTNILKKLNKLCKKYIFNKLLLK